jgi:hypothetical protein
MILSSKDYRGSEDPPRKRSKITHLGKMDGFSGGTLISSPAHDPKLTEEEPASMIDVS